MYYDIFTRANKLPARRLCRISKVINKHNAVGLANSLFFRVFLKISKILNTNFKNVFSAIEYLVTDHQNNSEMARRKEIRLDQHCLDFLERESWKKIIVNFYFIMTGRWPGRTWLEFVFSKFHGVRVNKILIDWKFWSAPSFYYSLRTSRLRWWIERERRWWL